MLFFKRKKRKKTKAEKFAKYKESVKNRLGEVMDDFFEELEKDYVRRIEIEVEELDGDSVFLHCNLEPFEMRDRAKEVKGHLPAARGVDWKICVDGVEGWEKMGKGDGYRKTVTNKPERSKEWQGWWRYYAERKYGAKGAAVTQLKEIPATAEK